LEAKEAAKQWRSVRLWPRYFIDEPLS